MEAFIVSGRIDRHLAVSEIAIIETHVHTWINNIQK